MSREEIEKLLGGYATDTLTGAERRALFEAALEDQELFDALAREQALRDVLRDPAAREQLLESLGPGRPPATARSWLWLRRPAVLAMAGGLATLLIAAGLWMRQSRRVEREEVLLADVVKVAPPAAGPAPAAKLAMQQAAQKPQKAAGAPENRLAKDAGLSRDELSAAPAAAVNAPAPAPPPEHAAPAAPLPPQPVPEPLRQALEAMNEPSQNFTTGAASGGASMKRAKALGSLAARPPVTYTLLLKGANGDYAPAPADTVLHVGDSVRIQATPAGTGHLYLFQKDAGGAWNPVANQAVEGGQGYVMPSGAGLESGTPGRLELLLVFSRRADSVAAQQAGDAGALRAITDSEGAQRITLEFR